MTVEPDSPKKRACLEDQFIYTTKMITSKFIDPRDISERCDLINEEHPRIRNATTVQKQEHLAFMKNLLKNN